MIPALLLCAADYGPAALLTLLALVMEQHREAPNGTDPSGNIVYRILAGGMIVAGSTWLIGSAIALLRGAPSSVPHLAWMFALGEAIGLLSLFRSRASGQPIDM